MKIKKLIAEEVKLILLENNILKAMEAVPPEEIEAAIAELTPIVQAELPKYAEENAQEGAVAEGAGESLQQGMAKLLTIVPGGRDLGAMYLAAIDKSTDPKIRTLFLVALVNLIAPVDLGTILSGGLIEFLGPLTALDDYLLVRKVLKLMKKQGLPSEKHHDQLSQLAGEEEGEIRDPGSGTTIPPGFTRVWGPDANEDDPEGLKERRMISVSRINRIIKEELEVVLTNEEVEEMFDLDMSALLDEMMEEGLPFMKDVERSRQGKIPPAQAAKIKAASTAMQTRAGDPSRTSQGSEEEEEDLTKPTEVSEITTVSTDDLYLAEMFDTGSDTKESCAAKGGQWNEASQKCEFLEEAEDKSFSKAAKEIEKKGTEGVFTAKAKKAGMGVQAYAAKVLKKGSKASTKTKRQAAFAKGAATVARENK